MTAPSASPASGRLLVLSLTPGSGFGAERVLEYLLEGGAALGWQRRLVVASPPASAVADTARRLGYPWLPWKSQNFSLVRTVLPFARFRWENRRLRLARIHAWHTRAFEWAVLLGRPRGISVTATLHDHPAGIRVSPARRRIIRRSVHAMGGVAVVSASLGQVCAASGWRVPLFLARNGLPDLAPPPAPDRAEPVVAFLGLNEPHKGLARVFDWIGRTADLPCRWKFFGSPTPATRPMLDRLLRLHGRRAEYLGRQAPAAIYAQADLVCHPSQAFDPYPTVLLEAARAGLPVLTSDAGGSAEIVRHEETGLVFPLRDASAGLAGLRRLIGDAALRRQLGSAARQRFENEFGVAAMVERYRQFWRF